MVLLFCWPCLQVHNILQQFQNLPNDDTLVESFYNECNILFTQSQVEDLNFKCDHQPSSNLSYSSCTSWISLCTTRVQCLLSIWVSISATTTDQHASSKCSDSALGTNSRVWTCKTVLQRCHAILSHSLCPPSPVILLLLCLLSPPLFTTHLHSSYSLVVLLHTHLHNTLLLLTSFLLLFVHT